MIFHFICVVFRDKSEGKKSRIEVRNCQLFVEEKKFCTVCAKRVLSWRPGQVDVPAWPFFFFSFFLAQRARDRPNLVPTKSLKGQTKSSQGQAKLESYLPEGKA